MFWAASEPAASLTPHGVVLTGMSAAGAYVAASFMLRAVSKGAKR
jgi:hypothetical protein